MNVLEVILQPERDPESNETFMRAIAKVDGQPLLNFTYFELAVDLGALQRSIEKDGEYFIITCACGDAGCAGIQQGIKVAHTKSRTQWVYKTLRPDPVTQPELLKPTPSRRPEWVVRGVELPTRTFIFDREAYSAAIRQGVKRAAQLVKKYGAKTFVPVLHREWLVGQ